MTTHDGTQPACREVEDALAQVLDGTAPASLFDHIADCDACRDLRHDAARAAEIVGHAGADFHPASGGEGFATELMARLDASLVSSGRISGATSAGASSPRPDVAPDARTHGDGTIQGMPLVSPDEARARAAAKSGQSGLDHPTLVDAHRTTPGLSDAPSSLAVGEARRGGDLANAPTTFAPLQGSATMRVLPSSPRRPPMPAIASRRASLQPSPTWPRVASPAPPHHSPHRRSPSPPSPWPPRRAPRRPSWMSQPRRPRPSAAMIPSPRPRRSTCR
jgi:hypothetical protein